MSETLFLLAITFGAFFIVLAVLLLIAVEFDIDISTQEHGS